jgi:DNA helicase-2/ATP-dependent DNA helicase PcrA
MQLDGVTPTEQLAYEILEKEWNSAGFSSETQENQAKENARIQVKSLVKWLNDNPNTPIAAEKSFALKIQGIPFNGIIDRIEKTPDGKYEVIDFKTGSVRENSKSIKTDPQMNMYALGVESLYKELPVKTSLYYIKHDKFVENNIEKDKVNEVKETVENVVKSILNEEFEAKPSFQACRFCDYQSICEAKELEE